jgi:hypothetical protein
MQVISGARVMIAQKKPQPSREDEHKKADLDCRYGEIGISAVAGALKHQPCEKPKVKDREIVPHDCD